MRERLGGSSRLAGQRTQELALLLGGLEAAVAELGRSIDELEVDRLEVGALGGRDDRLAESDGPLLRSGDATLEHHPVLVDRTVVREATHGCDGLLGEIRLGGSALVVALLADAQHTLVDLGAVVVTHLTRTSHGEADTSRMPCTNASNLAETTVSLAREAGDTPTSNDTDVAVTFRRGADIKGLTLTEHLINANLLLEQTDTEVNLGSDIATVDLDLHQVRRLLAELQLASLGVCKDTHNAAVLLDAINSRGDILRLLGSTLGVLGEGLLLGTVPVLVETTLDFIRQVSSPDGSECSEAIWGGDVANNANDNHWRGFKNGNGLNSFLLVQLGARTFDFSNNVGHAGLVAHECSQVHWSGGIVTRERANATTMVLCSLLRQVLQRAVARSAEFTMRHG